MTRLIEVSHWGNIAVEETYHVVHSGAVLKGSFSRYDYQRSQDGVSSVKSFKVGAHDFILYTILKKKTSYTQFLKKNCFI